MSTASNASNLEINGATIETDEQGYLVNPEDWNLDLAETLAQKEGLLLTHEHIRVLQFMRAYFHEHQIAVDARFVIKFIDEQMGYGAQARKRLYELFPYGYMQQACKIAGMKRPRAWSTG